MEQPVATITPQTPQLKQEEGAKKQDPIHCKSHPMVRVRSRVYVVLGRVTSNSFSHSIASPFLNQPPFLHNNAQLEQVMGLTQVVADIAASFRIGSLTGLAVHELVTLQKTNMMGPSAGSMAGAAIPDVM
ncbi:hypothetical protein VNO77_19649 [Canavalia gladiata]|uniref:Uncharacterized protein n=1 Tax=Canavalia gladiata TaxID=3824 RepID=A0AAN9LMX3_CANGL